MHEAAKIEGICRRSALPDKSGNEEHKAFEEDWIPQKNVGLGWKSHHDQKWIQIENPREEHGHPRLADHRRAASHEQKP